jgi:hypothetical protein
LRLTTKISAIINLKSESVFLQSKLLVSEKHSIFAKIYKANYS